MMELTFPDGTRVRAGGWRFRKEVDEQRDFGLYMDPIWAPTWSADMIDWPDFGVPTDSAKAAAQIKGAFERAKSGERVEIGCIGGLGRTGSVLACMAILAGVPPIASVKWVRSNYDVRAVENDEQRRWVLWFGQQVDKDLNQAPS